MVEGVAGSMASAYAVSLLTSPASSRVQDAPPSVLRTISAYDPAYRFDGVTGSTAIEYGTWRVALPVGAQVCPRSVLFHTPLVYTPRYTTPGVTGSTTTVCPVTPCGPRGSHVAAIEAEVARSDARTNPRTGRISMGGTFLES